MPSERSEIARRVMDGRPLDDMPVIDFHTHLDDSADYYWIPRSDNDHVLGAMDRFGIDHAVTFSIALHTDVAEGNRVLMQRTWNHRNRFSPLVVLHAFFEQDWLSLLEAGASGGARGIKLISAYQKVPEQAIDWSPALEYARGRGWVVLNHGWGDPSRLEQYARSFLDVHFVIGHISTAYTELLTRYDNVWQCTCAHFACAPNLTTEAMVQAMPVEKILFGSDALDLDPGTAIGPIALADISEDDKRRILGGNAVRLIERLGWTDIAGVPASRTDRSTP